MLKTSQRDFLFTTINGEQLIAAATRAVSARNSSESSSNERKVQSWWVFGSLLAAAVIAIQFQETQKAESCGIAGVVGTPNHDARDFLLEGLAILKNRGYDSAGLATMRQEGGPLVITKFASDGDKADSIELVRAHSQSSDHHSIGIAHTRWATHGGKTDENAHPHTDSSGKIALVHNGTIFNSNDLRRELQSQGHVFTSQTDTEVIAKLIGHYYAASKGITVKEATEKALARCEGTWGLCIMCSDTPDELVVACNGSPLVVGVAEDRTFVASETAAFNRYTKHFLSMKDGEIGVLHSDGRTLDLTRKQLAPDQEVKLNPDPFPHWTLKELTEQPEALARALNFGARLGADDKVYLGGLDSNHTRLSKIKHMTLSACGTSLNAARYGEKLMKYLGSFDSVTSSDAAETEAKDFPCQRNIESTGLIVVSQSGETKDVVRVVNNALERGITVLSVVNAVGSLIARTTNMGVFCNAGRENAVASTKAFTTQVTVLALVALWFRQVRDAAEGKKTPPSVRQVREALMRLPITFGMALKTREHCQRIAKKLENKEHCFVLGKGYGEPVAMEGALKIKEMCYLHAEGYSGGALKHGPFALIEDNNGKLGATPIIMLILDDQHSAHMRTAAEEVRARGGDVIVITDKASLARDIDEDPIIIPNNGPLTALAAVLPLQLIAYELAMLRGINPDTPRNLAKAVTVD
ncbi:hypothetical protein ACA910_021148 [Epithemia clementina (nom. ined.)]